MLSKTMNRVLFFITFTIVLVVPSFGEEVTSTNQTVTSVKTPESSPHKSREFEWEMVLASEQLKDGGTASVLGQYTTFKNSFLYSATDNDQVRIYGSYVVEDYKSYQDKKYLEFGEAMYRRKSILNEEEHFVNLDFELKYGVVLDREIRKYWGFDSETIPQIIVKKKLGNGYGVEFKARHHFYNRNNNKARAITNEDRLYLSGYKMFGHQFLINTELKYRHKIYTGNFYSYERGGMMNKNYEEVVIHPGLLYFVNRKVLLEGYVESKLNTSFDNKKLSKVVRDEFLIGAALYFTII